MDQSSVARTFLRFKLKVRGYRVLSAKDGARAVRLAQKMHPQLVITGLLFPDTTGTELLSALRDINPRLPVVVLTMRLQESDMIEALRLGAVDYITKPYRVGELLARVDRLLQEPYRPPEASLEVLSRVGAIAGLPVAANAV